MSSQKYNGFESRENKTSSPNSCATSKKKPESLDPDLLYEKYMSDLAKEMHEEDSPVDDFDLRFMDQLYKERDNSDGWDKYLEILQSELNNDHYGTSPNIDTCQQNGACSTSHTSSKSKAEDGNSHCQNLTNQSKEEKHGKSQPIEGQKNCHYFRNGTCYYGNPIKDKITENEKKKKSEFNVDKSELQFYKNLRKYFGTAKEISEQKTSQTSQKKTSEGSTSSLDKGTNYFSTDEAKGKSPSSQVKPNGFSNGKENLTNGLSSENSECISTSQAFSKKKPSKKPKEEEVYSAKCKNTREKPSRNDLTSVESGKENTKKPLPKNDTVPSQNDPNISSKVCNGNTDTAKLSKRDYQFPSGKRDKSKSNDIHKHIGNSSKSNTEGKKLENHTKSCKTELENSRKSSEKQDAGSIKSDPLLSSEKRNEKSPVTSSSLKDSKEKSSTSENNGNVKSQMKSPMSASQGEVNDKSSQPSSTHSVPSEQNLKSNFSKHKTVADKGTQSSKRFGLDKDKKQTQRRPSFEKDEFKSQSTNEKHDKKTKKTHETPEDKHKSTTQASHSSTSRVQKDRKLPKQRMPDSSKDFESHFQRVRHSRPSKEEMIRRISPNEALESLLRRLLYAVKEIGIKCLKVLCWILYYAILITAVVILCLFTILKGTVLYVYGYVMSLGVTIAIIDKLWLGKVYLSSWYYTLKEFIREKVYGPKRAAQTYNLPNSGEDAVQQLLIRQAPDNNPYRILGVPKEATDEDIRKQYRKFAVLVHPDKNKHPQSAEAFQILSSAYDILGDSSKRQEYDREVARKEQVHKDRASGNFMKDPADYTNPHDFFADFVRQMEEIRESLACNVCGGRHRRRKTDRNVFQARFCSQCNTLHQAKEGDFWKESTGFLGLGPGKFYTCMDYIIYDITDWGLCQERTGFHLPTDSHRVCGKVNSHRQQPPPRQRFTEEDLFRDLFGQQNAGGGGHNHHSHRSKQQKRRRKKK